MGLLDSLLGGENPLGGLAKLASANPQIVEAATSLLSSSQDSIGGSSGLTQLIGSLQGSGLQDVVSTWFSNGANKSIGADQISAALGSDAVSAFADRAGVSGGEAGSLLAGILPEIINQLTPNGSAPNAGDVNSLLDGFMSSLKAG